MDSQINAAALALAAGDPLAALQRVSLRADAPALALRGIAMAQLGELTRATELLRRAARDFGARAPRARARCLLAGAEVALAARDFRGSRALDRALPALEAVGDRVNVLHGRCLEVRRALLLGQVALAEARLSELDLTGAPPMLEAVAELLAATVELRRLRSATARAALERAERAARRSAIDALVAEVEAARRSLDVPVARCISSEGERPLALEAVEALLETPAFIVDACRRVVRREDVTLSLRRRPILFSLLRTLAEAWPEPASRDVLLARTFGVRRVNDTHRARLRVEVGRLRRALRPLAELTATASGFALQLRRPSAVLVLAPPLDHPHGDVLGLLGDGEAWSSSAIALALGTSQRGVQRALRALQEDGRARSIGSARARRWLSSPLEGFTTLLLLPPALPVD